MPPNSEARKRLEATRGADGRQPLGFRFAYEPDVGWTVARADGVSKADLMRRWALLDGATVEEAERHAAAMAAPCACLGTKGEWPMHGADFCFGPAEVIAG